MTPNDIARAIIEKGSKTSSGLVLIFDEFTLTKLLTELIEASEEKR